jgi:hypothetical protein
MSKMLKDKVTLDNVLRKSRPKQRCLKSNLSATNFHRQNCSNNVKFHNVRIIQRKLARRQSCTIKASEDKAPQR